MCVFLSSPEQEVLKVSFCGRPLYIVRCPSSTFFFKHLLLNKGTNLDENWQGSYLGESLPKLLKRLNSTHSSGCDGNRMEKIAKSSKMFFSESRAFIFGMLYQVCSYDAPGVKTAPVAVHKFEHRNKEG